MKKCINCGAEASDEQIFCPHCGTRLQNPYQTNLDVERLNQEILQKNAEINGLRAQLETTGKKSTGTKWVIISIVLLIACISSVVFAVQKTNEAEYYSHRYYSEHVEYLQLSKQANFMDKYIAIIDSNSDDKLYHTYNCETWNWDGSWSIRAYNISSNGVYGYEPCPKCH